MTIFSVLRNANVYLFQHHLEEYFQPFISIISIPKIFWLSLCWSPSGLLAILFCLSTHLLFPLLHWLGHSSVVSLGYSCVTNLNMFCFHAEQARFQVFSKLMRTSESVFKRWPNDCGILMWMIPNLQIMLLQLIFLQHWVLLSMNIDYTSIYIYLFRFFKCQWPKICGLHHIDFLCIWLIYICVSFCKMKL